MKKLLVLFCLLAICAGGVQAKSMTILGVGMGYASQNDAAGRPWNATSLGVLVNFYSEFMSNFGLYGTLSGGFILSAQDNGTALDLGHYSTGTLDLNMLFGLGYQPPLRWPWSFEVGAGLFWGITSLVPSLTSLAQSYLGGGLGPGIGLSVTYQVAKGIGIGANLNAAYILSNPFDNPPTMASTGLKFFGGVGISF